MNEVNFPYDEWVTDAMRNVLRRALKKLTCGEDPGQHHLYINFETTGDNVSVPDFLKAQYPDEITIVLQHQFQNLYLDDSGFEVTLSFGGQNQRLYIPFDVVTSFADPSVNFGIQIKSEVSKSTNTDEYSKLGIDNKNTKDHKIEGVLSKGQHSIISPEGSDGANNIDPQKKLKHQIDGAEVINIEAFRKK